MQMSHFSTDLQHSLTNFHKPTTMDPTRFHQPGSLNRTEADDRVSATTNNTPVSPYEKETMFEKPLTPSDVGKLNRLVIPKQYAEKYFPLSGGGGDTSGGLLGFEEESGKCWRFRYSYWNSSQSYVLTKGWSRYVKDKGLDAGDVVFFERHRSDPDRLFIGWRRRGAPPPPQLTPAFCYNAPGGVIGIPPYQGERRRHHAGGVMEPTTTTPARNGNNNPTRLVRLFGVNFECQSDPDSPSQTTSSHSYSDPIQSQHQHQQEAFRNYFNYMGHHPQQHMVMDMDGDNQMGNHLG